MDDDVQHDLLSFARHDNKEAKEYQLAWRMYTNGSVAINNVYMNDVFMLERRGKNDKSFVRCEVRTHDLWITLI